jgi:hypothetical protein
MISATLQGSQRKCLARLIPGHRDAIDLIYYQGNRNRAGGALGRRGRSTHRHLHQSTVSAASGPVRRSIRRSLSYGALEVRHHRQERKDVDQLHCIQMTREVMELRKQESGPTRSRAGAKLSMARMASHGGCPVAKMGTDDAVASVARHAEAVNTSTSHVGFHCILRQGRPS